MTDSPSPAPEALAPEQFDDLKSRVENFHMLSLPGQPQGMHMGTSYLVNDLWDAVQRLQDELLIQRPAPPADGLARALLVLLDNVDYTDDACGPTEMIAAVLSTVVIQNARDALAAYESGKPPAQDRLREALAPFAKQADAISDDTDDVEYVDADEFALQAGAYRRARRALKGGV